MTNTKMWRLIKDDFSTEDGRYVIELGAWLEVNRPSFGQGNRRVEFGRPIIRIQTTTPEQENMLQLKYSPHLILLDSLNELQINS